MQQQQMLAPGKKASVEARAPELQTAEIEYEDGRRYQYNLCSLFEFRKDLATANAQHSAIQQFWETLAVDLIFSARQFEEDGYARWWAHARRHARFVLRTMGARDTIELVKDWVVTLFNASVEGEERTDFARAAWKGQLIERHGSDAAADKAIALNKSGLQDLAVFEQNMYVYFDAGWTYEQIMKTLRTLEEQAQKVQTIAKTLQDRSFKMHEFTELEKAKFGNVGPMTVDELVDQVASRILKKSQNESGTMKSSVNDADVIASLTK